MSSSSRIDWLLFVVLGFFWGSSYLFIKIGVDAGLPPFMLITLRLLIGFALLVTVVAVAREPSRAIRGPTATSSSWARSTSRFRSH